MGCDGTPDSHCCWIDGQTCRYLLTIGPRVWCALMLEHGDWQKVHADPRYQADVQPTFDRLFPGYGCGDYPQSIPAVMNSPTSGKCCYG